MPSPTRLSAQRSPACPVSAARFCACNERTRAGSPLGLTSTRSPTATLPESTVPVTTVPVPCSVNERSTASRNRPLALRAPNCAAASNSCCRRASMPIAGRRRHRHDLGAGQAGRQQACSRSRSATSASRSASTRSLLVSATRPCVDAEQIDDRQMLDGLRHDAVVRGDDQQHEVDAGRAGQHVVDEALVPGHVDEADGHAFAGRQIGEAEIDRDAARLLLLQAVGIDAGQRPHQRGLAVIDMARGADDHATGSGSGIRQRGRSRRRAGGQRITHPP